MVLFGQIVIGPPGAGKSTYCRGMEMFINALERKCDIVNLDFANDSLSYTPAIDVRELVSLESVMNEHHFGPNGGLVFCMETLLKNIDWLISKLTQLESNYVIFDCPGQVELFTHHTCVQDLIRLLEKSELDCRLCSVSLIDSFYCSQPATFISAVLLVTCSMLRLGLPHINVLSKVDLLCMYGPLPFNLDFFTEMMDLMPLVRYIDSSVPTAVTDTSDEATGKEDSLPSASRLQSKLRKMSEALCDVLNDYGLVQFLPMNVQDGETVGRVLAAADKANGFSMANFQAKELAKAQKESAADPSGGAYNMFKVAAQHMESVYGLSMDIQERYGYHNQSQEEPQEEDV